MGEPVSDLEAIQTDVRQRGITRLCHFTRSEKLAHMLAQTQAILPTQELRERYPDLLDVTDTQRLDGRLEYICCSIEYPNTWYLSKIKAYSTPFHDWIILCLDPCLLWERDALFSPRNAAAQRGALLTPGWQGWRALFHPEVQGAYGIVRGRTPHHLQCCPTDDQAEVLGIRLRRDNWVSVRYAEELNSGKSSVTPQRTDRHGILGEKLTDFQVSL